MRLSIENARLLSETVARPRYVVAERGEGIVHLGIGAFHRAHQAVYADDAMAQTGGDWRIVGVSLRSGEVRDALVPQDCLYTVTEQRQGVQKTRLVSAVSRVLVAPEDPEAVLSVLSSRQICIVTLTITEKGYFLDGADGMLLLDDRDVASDLSGAPPRTIYGFLAQALARRKATGAGGLTIMSCDNMTGNGAILERLLGTYLNASDPNLMPWVIKNVTFPSTMVDRIVPAQTPADLKDTAARICVKDLGAIITEPFRQWIIEDRFAGPRPAWEAGGAVIVDDVRPFELVKLRLLNASHSTLAYLGLPLGLAFVHEAASAPLLRRFVREQALSETAATLVTPDALDPARYIDDALERFANTDIRHLLRQIAQDGSQKVFHRWMSTILERAVKGKHSPLLLASLAAWIGFTRGGFGDDGFYEVHDPLAHAFALIWRDDPDADTVVRRILRRTDVLPPSFADHSHLVAGLKSSLGILMEDGVEALVRTRLDDDETALSAILRR